MRRLFPAILLLAVMGPARANAFTTELDMFSPGIDGGVIDAAKMPVFNAVITAISVDPGRTFKYYMISDFNGWIFIDCADALDAGYRGGFVLRGFKKDVGSGTVYAASPNIKLYGNKSLVLTNKAPVTFAPPGPGPEPGFYIAGWSNSVTGDYDIVVYNPLSLTEKPEQVITAAGDGHLGPVIQHRKSYFFRYRPGSTGMGFTIQTTGHDRAGTLHRRSFAFQPGCSHVNTGFISRSGGTVCLGKDDPTRLEVPPNAYVGDKTIPVTIYRLKHLEGTGTIYEFQPHLEFSREVSLVVECPDSATIESWDERTLSWVHSGPFTTGADGTVRIQTRRIGRILARPKE